MSLVLTPDQPWLGLASYEESHRPYFFGRKAEEEDLFERVRRHRLTVLYGPSGLGKTSLLRAGLMPRLEADGWLPVRIRLSYPERLETIVEADPQSLLLQVLETLAKALETKGHPTAEKLRAVLGPSSEDTLPTLWELWHDTAWGLRDAGGPRIVLLFDQFEEIFTLGEDEARARSAARILRDALADLIEDRPSPALDRRLTKDPAFAERFDFSQDAARVMLVLREDYLSRLERWKKLLPSLLRNRLELRLLDGPRALEAVTGPARSGLAPGEPGLVTDEVAADIVRAVSDVLGETPIEDIEAVPPLLSLLCKELNEKRRAAEPPAAQIDRALVQENRSAILQRFYVECFSGFPPAVRLVIEDLLLSPGGYRENPGYDTLIAALTARSVPDPEQFLTTLTERRLITAEDRGGRRRVELTHDVLAPIVKRSLDERREREAADEAQRLLVEESEKSRRRRYLISFLTVLTVMSFAGAFYGWYQATIADQQRAKAVKSEERAQAEAKKAEASLVIANSELDRASLEEGKTWLERARSAQQEGDNFTAIMFAGRALGFVGYGAEESAAEGGEPFRTLLGRPLLANSEAEEEREKEALEAKAIIADLRPSLLPIWSSPIGAHLQNTVTSVAFSPDGTRLASGSRDRTVKLWNDYTLNFWNDTTVKLWDVASGKELGTFAGHSDGVSSVAFSPDGTRLASGSLDKTVKLWDVASGRELSTLVGHAGDVMGVAFSPDGARLASGSRDSTVKLWDVASGKELSTFAGDSLLVFSVAFSPDGKRLASGSFDNTVKLWDVASGKELSSFAGHTGSVSSVAFSPDGARLASGSGDNTVKLWDVSPRTGSHNRPDFPVVGEIQGEFGNKASSMAMLNENSPFGSPRGDDLLYFLRQGLFSLNGREIVWRDTSPSLDSSLEFTPQHYRNDEIAGLAKMGLAPTDKASLMLALMAKSSQWRPALVYWAGLISESPEVVMDIGLRQQYLTLLFACALSPLATQSPDSLGKLVPEIVATLEAEAGILPHNSLPLAQLILALAAKSESLVLEEHFVVLLKKAATTTTPEWRQSVVQMAAAPAGPEQSRPELETARRATIVRLLNVPK